MLYLYQPYTVDYICVANENHASTSLTAWHSLVSIKIYFFRNVAVIFLFVQYVVHPQPYNGRWLRRVKNLQVERRTCSLTLRLNISSTFCGCENNLVWSYMWFLILFLTFPDHLIFMIVSTVFRCQGCHCQTPVCQGHSSQPPTNCDWCLSHTAVEAFQVLWLHIS